MRRELAKLVRLPWAQEVTGSNPGAPTNYFLFQFRMRLVHRYDR